MPDVRLIDANALLRSFDVAWMVEYDETGCGVNRKAIPVESIENAPTIDAVPVAQGRLEGDHLDYKCSACGTAFHDDIFWIQGDRIAPKHCPECGAKWTEVANE